MSKMIRGGGGGCFAAGTIVACPDGERVIEDIKVGDLVYSFDDTGRIKTSKVSEVFLHESNKIYKVSFWGGEFYITLNHWVLNQYNAFVEVGSLSPDDCIVDAFGHLRPIKSFEFVSEQPVYNLKVEDDHTFFADGIRVHNGGKGTVRGFGGGGGKGGGGGHTPVESTDSIRSKQYARVVDLLCEGEIGGLVDGAKSVYLDNTPLQNADLSYNFADVSYSARVGTQNQTYLEGYPSVEAEQNVGVEVTYDTPVTRQITNANIDRVRLTVALPALYQQQTNGDLTGATVSYKIEVQANGGGFVPTYFVGEKKTYAVSSSAFSLPDLATGVTFSARANIAAVLGTAQGVYELQYKKSSDISWVTLAQKNLYVHSTGISGLFGPSYEPYTSISATVSGLTSDLYDVQVVKLSGDGTAALTNVIAIIQANTTTVSDKTTSRYQRSHDISLTGSAPWDVRVTRITEDSTSSSLQNKTIWESYTEIIDAKLSYPNSALVGISIDAAQFSSIPTRSYDVKLLKVKIPSNYNPLTRVYTGVWDGTFTVAWTDNPAWCFYDILTNTRYGLGSYIDTSLVDTAQLYQIAQYCDVLVDDGFGNTEPRFTCNLYLQTREEAYKVIGNMASIFRGMTYWSTGSIFAVQDSPQDVFSQFTNADVLNGEFVYSGSARHTRHSVALVTWNDPEDSYRQKIEYVEDAEAIARFGIRETEQIAIGCTSRGQAHRMGRWILYTERYETEVLAFKTGLKGTTILPGKIIQTMDNNRAGVRFGGRLLSATTTSATLDAAVTIESGKTYSINLVLPDGTVEERTITNAIGSASVITWSTALSATPENYSVWILTASDLSAEKWRVLSVTEESKGVYSVNAVSHYDGKYALVEDGVAFDPPQTSYLDATFQAPVTELAASLAYYTVFGSPKQKIIVSWLPSPGATSYLVSYKAEGFPLVTVQSNSPSIDILDVLDGDYTYSISVFAISSIGVRSVVTSINFSTDVTDAIYTPIATVASMIVTGGLFENKLSLTVDGLMWESNVIEVWESPDNNRANALLVTSLKDPVKTFSRTGLAPAQTYYYWCRVVDAAGHASAWYPSSSVAGVAGTPSSDPSYLLEQLQTAVTVDQLALDLTTRIDKIDTSASLSGLPGGLVTTAELHQSRLREIDFSLDNAANGLLEAVLKTASIDQKINDAGIVVNPDTSEVYIYGLEAYKDENNTRVSEAEIRLDGAEADISLKASVSYVDNKVAEVASAALPYQTYSFNNSNSGWTASGATLSVGVTSSTLESTGTSPLFISPTLSFDGSVHSVVTIKVKRLTGSGWVGKLQWSHSGHGYSATYEVPFSEPEDFSNYRVIQVLLAEVSDWTTNTITGIQVLFGNTASDDFEIDEVEIGPRSLMSLLLTDVDVRLSQAEIDINGAEAAITLKASQIDLDGVDDRLVVAEGEIDVLQGQIVLKANTTTVDAIDARLDVAETTLNTIDGASIVDQVASIRKLNKDRDALAEANLNTLLFGDRNVKELGTAIATAKNELYAFTTSEIEAEAGARLALAATVADNTAEILDEQIVRANTDSVLAVDITTIEARLDSGDFAAVKVQSSATANALGDVEAKWGVQVQSMSDGVMAMAGLELLSGADGESVVGVLADKFVVYKPDGTGTPKQVMSLGTVNGSTALGIDGSLIVDDSIVARHLSVGSITANKIAAGAITTEKIGANQITADLIISASCTSFERKSISGTNGVWVASSFYMAHDGVVAALTNINFIYSTGGGSYSWEGRTSFDTTSSYDGFDGTFVASTGPSSISIQSYTWLAAGWHTLYTYAYHSGASGAHTVYSTLLRSFR